MSLPATAAQTPTALIRARNVAKWFQTRTGTDIEALRDINLDIDSGSFVALVGPSGCGKSTLLRLIAGLIEKTGGSLTLDGAEVEGPTESIGMVFQNPVLLPWRTVFENVTLCADLAPAHRSRYFERARHFLQLVGLSSFDASYPSELSGGMQQRVGIVRALVHDPAVLLMDEPFAALDAMTRERMQVELQSLWMGDNKTVVFVTHSISEAVFLADKIAVLAPRPGRVVEEIKVPLARPRTIEMVSSDVFGHYVNAVRRHFTEQSGPR